MKNWKKVKLGSLLTESKIVVENPNAENRIRVKLNVLGVEKRPDIKDKKGATKYYTRKSGQFIYGKQNLHKGAFGIVPKELDNFESSSDIPAFDVDDSCYPEWIFYFFKKGKFYLKLDGLAKGVGSKRIRPEQIYKLDIYLPTKQEQRKILDEIEKAETNNQDLIQEIQLQESSLSKLRQSILQDAIKGELTKEWREKNPNINSIKELFEKIKLEKEQINKENKIKKETPKLPINDDEIPFEIPHSWQWCRLSDIIIDKPKNGYSPRGVTYKTNTKSLKLGATTKGIFNPSEVKYIDETIPKESSLWLNDGDILIQRSNSIDYVGVSAIYKGKSFDFIYPDLMMKIRCSIISMTEYLYIILSSPNTREYFRNNASGTSGSMPKINQDIVSNTLIPCCILEEQEKIVEKVNQLLRNCDTLEQQILERKESSEKLIHSIFSKLLGDENNDSILINKNITKEIKVITSREIKYNSKTVNMKIVELLKVNGRLHAEDLWKMSEHYNKANESDSIDKFYAELKKQIEEKRTIKESSEKGYLELI
jgi:type I restriction enzyme S subunit